MTYNKGHKGLLRAWFTHNIYYPRINYFNRFLLSLNRQDRGLRKFYEIVGDILGAICVFAIAYMWLLIAGVLQ
tara:strand:- start:298 stop:516 length:219 start_codon:yes stop_codon:yes gene_type:complete